MSYRLDDHDRGHRDEGFFDDPGGTAELTLERWIAGDVDEVHLPVLPLGVLERHRDGELTLDGDVGSWRARAWAVSPPQGIRLQVEKLGVVRRPAFERRLLSAPRKGKTGSNDGV